MVFCSSSIYHVEPRLMVLIMHQSLNGCVLSFWRNSAAKLAVEWYFFMATPPIHKCNIVRAGFIELNHQVRSPDIAPTDCHLFLNLKKFVRDKNFSSDAGAIITVEDYLTDLNSELFCNSIQSLHDR